MATKQAFDPEIVFETMPVELHGPSQFISIKNKESCAGVALPQNRDVFRKAFDAFARGEVKVFQSSGLFGDNPPEFYEKSWEEAFAQLEGKGYFKKPYNQEGLHPNAFDTQVEGMAIGNVWLLKLTFAADDGIEEALAAHLGTYTALTASALEIEIAPVEVWWYDIDLCRILTSIGVPEALGVQVVDTLADPAKMHRKLTIPYTFQGRTMPLSLILVMNRRVRRLNARYARRVENRLQGPAWDKIGESFMPDAPQLRLSLALRERDKSLPPNEEFVRSHIWKRDEVDLIHGARDFIRSNLEQFVERKPLWRT